MVRKFIDKLLVHVKAGRGGNGLPKYAGVGGKGGNVWICSKKGETLKKLYHRFPSKRFAASAGEHSGKFRIQAAGGEDCVIHVPPGVEIISMDRKSIGDCDQEGDKVLAATGGDGGGPANGYIGQSGQSHSVFLLYKLIADIGLVGFPNAGKSSLLRAISQAKPKVANYPFTTLEPSVGVMQYQDSRQISVADLPGLIEGASRNVGLGHSFLRHVERTKLLLFVVDVFGFRLKKSDPVRSALETVAILNREIELYKPELLDKPAVLLVNKLDLEGSESAWCTIHDAMLPLSRGALLQNSFRDPSLRGPADSEVDCDEEDSVEAADWSAEQTADYQRLCAERLTPLISHLPTELHPRRWLQFEHILPVSALRGQNRSSQQQQQEHASSRQDHGGLFVSTARLKDVLRTTLDRCHDDYMEASGERPELAVLQRRLENGEYVPLQNRVVEMYRGRHVQRHRRDKQLPALC